MIFSWQTESIQFLDYLYISEDIKIVMLRGLWGNKLTTSNAFPISRPLSPIIAKASRNFILSIKLLPNWCNSLLLEFDKLQNQTINIKKKNIQRVWKKCQYILLQFNV